MKTQCYSYSKLSMYRQCPRRYFYRWVEKTKPIVIPQSVELFLGLRLHEAMRFLYQHHADGLMPTLDEVVAAFNARWDEVWSDAIDLGAKGHTAASIKAVGERAVRDYFARRQPFEDERTVGLEQPVSLWLDAAGLVDQWVDAEAERKTAVAALRAVEARIAAIKDGLTLVAEQEGLAKFFGDRGEVAVTVKDELIPPRKTHEPEKAAELEEALRASPWWQEVSALDRHAVKQMLGGHSAVRSELLSILVSAAVSARDIKLRLRSLIRRDGTLVDVNILLGHAPCVE